MKGRVFWLALLLAVVTALGAAVPLEAGDCYGWDTTVECAAQATTYGSCWGCCGIVFGCNVMKPSCGVMCRLIALSERHACWGTCAGVFG
ncbi:MAG: hypothetical protein NZ869_01025 [Thermoanaerobaculum sp.]|nr:hypothetical protein [Thermoanaerobaculum sp.]MDW7967699.1 hypothetical protein [Thermoanaerobaculum sp.]